MANTSAPFGFQPWGRVPGAAQSGELGRRLIAYGNGTAIYKGDVVTSLNTGYITASTAGTTQVAGIFWGCKYYNTTLKQTVFSPYWPGSGASADVEAYIINDPYQLFICQSGNGGPVTFASVGNNINLNVGTGGNTTTGISGMFADFATLGTTSTLPFRIYDLASNHQLPGVNGADATTAYDNIIVAPNWQDFRSTTGI